MFTPRSGRRALALLGLWSGTLLPSGLHAQAVVSGLSFGQLTWLDENDAVAFPNSSWGAIGMTVLPDPTLFYYLNVVANAGPGAAWIVQNFPLMPATVGSTAQQFLDFDISDLGVADGTALAAMDVLFQVDALPQGAAPLGAFVPTAVAAVAQGVPCGPLGGPASPAGVGAPLGHKATGAVTDLIQHKGVPGVEEKNKECLAGAFARSIAWLDQEHKLGYKKTPQQIYDDLSNAGVGSDPSYVKRVETKIDYTKGKGIRTKVLDLADAIGPVKGASEETGKDLVEWLYQEMRTEDVELHYDTHIVTLTSIYKQGGKVFVKFRDDRKRPDGTGGQGQPGGDDGEKEGELVKQDGKYVFRQKGRTDFEVRLAFSESVPEPSTVALVLAGLLALGAASAARRRSAGRAR